MRAIIEMQASPSVYLKTSSTPGHSVIEAYCDGYIQALRDFAVWKDGAQLVGCGVLTLEEVARRVEDDRLNLLDPEHAAGRL